MKTDWYRQAVVVIDRHGKHLSCDAIDFVARLIDAPDARLSRISRTVIRHLLIHHVPCRRWPPRRPEVPHDAEIQCGTPPRV